MIITNYAGAPGAGKSRAMMADIVRDGGRWIMACPRIDLIRERMGDLRSIAAATGQEPTLIEVHGLSGGKGAVVTRIRATMQSTRGLPHVVMAITHDSLMMLDPMDFIGWGVAIDEQVAGCKSGLTVLAARARMLSDYEIVPREGSVWHRIIATAGSVTLHDLLREHKNDPLIDVVKWARSPHGVLTTTRSWGDLIGSNRALRWVSVWTYGQLRHASRVLIAAAGLETSLTYLATRRLEPWATFAPQVVGGARMTRPTVIIRYFADKHRGSTSFWAKKNAEGRAAIMRIADYMTGQHVGYWSANDDIADLLAGRVGGQQVSAKVEGSNALRHLTSCMMIYSGKATPADEPLVDYLNLGSDAVLRARESEDIAQFVLRGALRQADWSGQYAIWVYDKWQAEWLAGYLADAGIAEATLEHVDLDGVAGLTRPKAGRREDTTRSGTEKAEARRARDRARKESKRREAGIKARDKAIGMSSGPRSSHIADKPESN